MKRRVGFAYAALLFTFSLPAAAAPFYGAHFSYMAIAKEPPYMHGFQIMLSYDPQIFKWRKFDLFFDGGFSHFWITNTPYHTTLNIYSAAPVIRYTFRQRGPFHPYIEMGIGFAYLNHTYLDDRNLGVHYAFQDRVGVGAYIGTTRQLSLGVHVMHYSNAHLACYNSGITAPLMVDIGYRFS